MAFDKTNLTHPFPYRQVGGGSIWQYSTTDAAPANDAAVSTYFTDRIITGLMTVGDMMSVVWEAGTTDATYVDFRCSAVSASGNTVTLVTINADTDTGDVVTLVELTYFSTTGTEVTIASQSDGSTNMVLIEPATTLTANGDSDYTESANGILSYNDAVNDSDVLLTLSLSIKATETTDEIFVVGLALAGSVIASSKQLVSIPAVGDIVNVTVQHMFIGVSLFQTLSAFIGNVSSTNNVTVMSYNLTAVSRIAGS